MTDFETLPDQMQSFPIQSIMLLEKLFEFSFTIHGIFFCGGVWDWLRGGITSRNKRIFLRHPEREKGKFHYEFQGKSFTPFWVFLLTSCALCLYNFLMQKLCNDCDCSTPQNFSLCEVWVSFRWLLLNVLIHLYVRMHLVPFFSLSIPTLSTFTLVSWNGNH